MRRWTIFLLLLSVFFCTVQPVQAADFTILKNEYIINHPGQSIIPFPWETSTSTRILPFNYNIPAAPGNNFSITACRNEFESGSFIISTQKSLSGIGISTADLTNDHGYSIPSSAIDIRLVKVWYQATDQEDIWLDHIDKTLYPELLLKDDSLVKVDYVNKINYLKVTLDGKQQYIDITNPTAVFPATATINDASSLQQFTMAANENKQIWLTLHVPADTPAGDYYGNIAITAPSETPVIMNFTVTVLPFDLEQAPLEYSLYYRGRLSSQAQGVGSELKTATQYSLELQDMKNHGVLYPTLYEYSPDGNAGTALSLRTQVGLPSDHIYLTNFGTGTSSDSVSLANLATRTTQWKNLTSQYGYSEIYAYGVDEAQGSVLESERIAWQTVKQNGGKIFVAGSTGMVDVVGDLLDVPVVAGTLNTTQATKWHDYGQKIFSYANPQVGVENSELYRKNYGFLLWNAGYDGTMNYAYQHAYGNIWNDFDTVSQHYRDHVFAYPTSNGVIDTIQWEGWREGVDDTRYLATLKNKEGNDISGRSIVSSSLSAGNNMATIRKKVIDRILLSNSVAPVASFTGTPVSGTAPLKVTFTDASTNSPTSWSWSFGDGSSVNATAKNPIHTYSAAGNYTVALTATNAAGSNTFTRTNYITVAAAPIKPVASFTGTPVSGTAPLKVTFTDASTNSPTSWAWSFGDGSSVNATAKNPIHTYAAAGNYTVSLTAANAAGNGNIVKTNYVTVTSVNHPPVMSSIADFHPAKFTFTEQQDFEQVSMSSNIADITIDEGKLLIFAVTATDPDGDILTYSASGIPMNAVFDPANHTFSWTPAYYQAGTYNVTFTVSDGALQDSKSVKIIVTNINTAPVLPTLAYKTTDEGKLLTFVITATDPEGDRLTYSAPGLPANALFDPASRTFSWTPAYYQAGTYNVTFTVSDGALQDSKSVKIIVNNTNTAPVLPSLADKTTDEGKLLTFVITATDPEGDRLTYSASGLPANALFDPASHTFSWTPAYDQAGIYTVTFRVSDGVLSDTKNVKITVNNFINKNGLIQKPTPTPTQSLTSRKNVNQKYFIKLQ